MDTCKLAFVRNITLNKHAPGGRRIIVKWEARDYSVYAIFSLRFKFCDSCAYCWNCVQE